MIELQQPDTFDDDRPIRSTWRQLSKLARKLAGDTVLVPDPDKLTTATRDACRPVLHWSALAEDDLPRLAILNCSLAQPGVSIVTLWRDGTPLVHQVTGKPSEEAVDLITDVINRNLDSVADRPAPQAANDNEPPADVAIDADTARRLEALRNEHGGSIFQGSLWGAEVEGQKGRIIIGEDGVAWLHTSRGAYALIERKPVCATPFVLGDPTAIPMRDWLFGKHFIRKYATASVGPGGGGKTAHSISETLAMVTGRPLLDPDGPLTKPLRVWWINLEDPQDEIGRRFHAAAKHFRVTNDQIGGRLFTDSGRDQEFVIARQTGRELKIVEPFVDQLVDEIRKRAIDLVIVDPFVSTHEAPENDNSAMQRVAAAWVRVADDGNCGVELVHHVVKGTAEITADSARGGGAFKDKVRSMRVFNVMTHAEAEKAGVDNPDAYFRVDMGKVNMVASGQSAWRRFVSVPLGNGRGLLKSGDEIGVVEPWRWPSADTLAERQAALRAAVVADVPADALAGLKVRLGNSSYKASDQAKLWAGHVVAEIFGLDAIEDKERIKEMLAVWIESGELEVVDMPDHRRHISPHIKPCAT